MSDIEIGVAASLELKNEKLTERLAQTEERLREAETAVVKERARYEAGYSKAERDLISRLRETVQARDELRRHNRNLRDDVAAFNSAFGQTCEAAGIEDAVSTDELEFWVRQARTLLQAHDVVAAAVRKVLRLVETPRTVHAILREALGVLDTNLWRIGPPVRGGRHESGAPVPGEDFDPQEIHDESLARAEEAEQRARTEDPGPIRTEPAFRGPRDPEERES